MNAPAPKPAARQPKKRRTRIQAINRQIILDAALEAFSTYGYRGSTIDQIAEAAEEAGLNINFGAIPRTPNTLNAHRLIHWAGLEGRQTAVVSALFTAVFDRGLDIGDTDVLVEVAAAAGMDAEVVRRLLSGDADAAMIRDRDTHARARGVTGVPTFELANQHVLVGAQPAELWVQVIDELMAQIDAEAQAGPS